LSNADEIIEGQSLRSYFNNVEWADLIDFEGNANALRVLTHPYRDKPETGMGLTFSTLASILKYPCEATAVNKQYKHRKKYGFFQTEKDTFLSIARELLMHEDDTDVISYRRHPFVYLVEAADDICYRVIDMEDAHRLGIISKEKVSDAFIDVLSDLKYISGDIDHITSTYHRIKDDNDSIAYLRAKVINTLTEAAALTFRDNNQGIINGIWNNTLIDKVEQESPALERIAKLSVKEIYNHHSVVEIEITGYHVMSHLLSLFVPAVLRSTPKGTDRMALNLIPFQFKEYEISDSPYIKAMSVVDFISGMTDSYATEFYRKTTGIDISKHS